jgi:predicted transcriptional regulator
LDGLDRMRVTLKLQVEHLSIRHNLDLYNDNQTEKLVRKVAERLEVGTSVVAAALMDLTDQLEQYRLTEIENRETKKDNRKMMSAEEIQKAKLYLSSPNLMERTMEDIGKAGVIGEELNRLLMYLVFTSRKRENPLHMISLGSSGIGKTHLQEKVGALIPEEHKIEITTLSGNAFYYFGQQELRNKLLLIEDLDGADEVLYPLREIKSKKRITKTVVVKNTKGETKTVTLTVEGPVSVAGCTTKESLYEDNANRSFLIYIDESKEQDEKIMHYQRKMSAGKVDTEEERKLQEDFKDMQRVLQPITIRNPFAEKLQIPSEVFKPRRTNAHYLAFIEAVTFYHQFQREKQYDKESGEEFIETTIEDIREANKLMKDILLKKSDGLTGACRGYFELLKAWLQSVKKESFRINEAMKGLRVKETTIRRYHKNLISEGLLSYEKQEGTKTYYYRVKDQRDYQELKGKIAVVLDGILEKLEKAS